MESWAAAAECEARGRVLTAQDYSIRFHVWDRCAMMRTPLRIRDRCGLPPAQEGVLAPGDDAIFAVRRG